MSNVSKYVSSKQNGHRGGARNLLIILAPQVRLELTTLRLTAECSAIELLRNVLRVVAGVKPNENAHIFIADAFGDRQIKSNG